MGGFDSYHSGNIVPGYQSHAINIGYPLTGISFCGFFCIIKNDIYGNFILMYYIKQFYQTRNHKENSLGFGSNGKFNQGVLLLIKLCEFWLMV